VGAVWLDVLDTSTEREAAELSVLVELCVALSEVLERRILIPKRDDVPNDRRTP